MGLAPGPGPGPALTAALFLAPDLPPAVAPNLAPLPLSVSPLALAPGDSMDRESKGMSIRTAVQLCRYSCASEAHPVKTLYANGSELSHWHKKSTSTNGKTYVGGRSSPTDIALCTRALMSL
ncbi:hypothetical protein UY3_03313 [Chelonia mydas]|uniref:Uncharacterized protein n=1 Tax=Chelonia mydas TaxID=8469 RepID=M7BQH8_CHEMY|nr:hypothetical protein UY3_03313 [Chelonia mydas]